MHFHLGEQLELRLLRPEDAEGLFHLIDGNRAFLRRWFEMPDLTHSAADSHAWIVGMLARREADPVRGWCGIFQSRQLIGCAGVAESEPDRRSAEIGYYLSADACGRGVATRACHTLVNHRFREHGLHRIGARIAGDNARSIRLIERLGFRCEGCIREADVFEGARRDTLLFGLLRREWGSA